MQSLTWSSADDAGTSGGVGYAPPRVCVTVPYPYYPLETRYTDAVRVTYAIAVTGVSAAMPSLAPDWTWLKWERNRAAALEGGAAQQQKHSRVPKNALVARTSYQGMARLPCYRGARPR
jgi:hypothetical protein